MQLGDLPTPALILDRTKLSRNIEDMSARAHAADVELRPHMKTAKSARVAELATAGHSGGITVSTLAEAEYFLDRGFTDITYGVCVAPAKLERAAALQHRGADLKLLTDGEEAVAAVGERAKALGVNFPMLIELDSGEHRTGVNTEGDELLSIADRMRGSPLVLIGVLTHAGHSYHAQNTNEVTRIAEDERLCVVRAAQRLREAGHGCRVVSAGSTPTAVHAKSFDGLTEIRPGVYMFGDLAQVGRGSCSSDRIAVSVLATVISHRPEHSRLMIDAGGLALSKDTSAQTYAPNTGYGWVLDELGEKRVGDLYVATADQEHGFVEGTRIPFDQYPVGSRVRVLPNHACMTAAAYREYAVVDGGREIVDVWDRTVGW
jgi:D-serine deaminase-like pyridoxal phosphate-dependent protein